MCRREAAALLGFASGFKVRQLEKAGRLHPARGIMGSAWYPRHEVLALREASDGAATPELARWTDAALILHLRGWAERDGAPPRPRTIVDLVADTGVPISRAEKVYRLWFAHDLEPAAMAARAAESGRSPSTATATATPKRTATATATVVTGASKPPGERRSGERLERDSLLQRMRDPDPKIRSAAFERLKRTRRPGA